MQIIKSTSLTMMRAANILCTYSLRRYCSKYFIQSIAPYPHTNAKSRYYYYWFHFIDEKNEVQR